MPMVDGGIFEEGVGVTDPADLFMKIWLELVVGGVGAGSGKLAGRWMGGLLFLLRRPNPEDFLWACSACC